MINTVPPGLSDSRPDQGSAWSEGFPSHSEEWGGWDSNPRSMDHESFEDLGGPCRSASVRGFFAGQAGCTVSPRLRLCRSVPVLASQLRPDTACGRPGTPGCRTITPARRWVSIPSAADCHSNARKLRLDDRGGASAPPVEGQGQTRPTACEAPSGMSATASAAVSRTLFSAAFCRRWRGNARFVR